MCFKQTSLELKFLGVATGKCVAPPYVYLITEPTFFWSQKKMPS